MLYKNALSHTHRIINVIMKVGTFKLMGVFNLNSKWNHPTLKGSTTF